MTGVARPVRRTQRERSEAMIARLLDATIVTIAEQGYRATSIQAISARAEVSRGALFAHFDSKIDLVLAAMAEVTDRIATSIRAEFDAGAREARSPEQSLRLLQRHLRGTESQVWLELLVAARTDPDLQARFNGRAIGAFLGLVPQVRELPGFDACPAEEVEGLFLAVLRLFQGSALQDAVIGVDPRFDELEILHALAMVEAAAARA